MRQQGTIVLRDRLSVWRVANIEVRKACDIVGKISLEVDGKDR